MANEKYTWNFQRMGGLDQVVLRSAEELQHFSELDPKLWVALSCPREGLCFDERTLALLDDDNDGRIRFQEIQAAVQWTAERLTDPALLVERRADLPLARIRPDTEEGQRLLASAHRILGEQHLDNAESLRQEDVAVALQTATKATFNGDGVLVDREEFDDDLRHFIRDIVQTLGGVPDASGVQGADCALAQKFMDEAKTLLDWKNRLDAAIQSGRLKKNTEKAWLCYQKVAAKIEDYFIRCRLAVYEPACASVLNAPEAVLASLGTANLDTDQEELAKLPLAHIVANQPLPIISSLVHAGLNPAWREAMNAFREEVVRPICGELQALKEENWVEIKQAFASYATILAEKPQTATEILGMERLAELQNTDLLARFAEVAEKDLAGKEEIAAIADVERLVLYHANLFQLLMNFVSFRDFYALSSSTTFQIGTLYIDGKSCNLCLAVNDVEQHAALAKQSQLCLVYCECTQRNASAAKKIVAAITAGSSNLILAGRHGVFVDNDGEEWDATVLKLVDNPIDLRAAVFAPYHRMARMASEQILKLTMSKSDKLLAGTTAPLKQAVTAPVVAPAPVATAALPKQPFDIGKSVGIFAAIGLALGALGTALAGIASALLSLRWWQFPILILGIFLLVSGPSVLLAWLKLRKRTLGPVLDASGWAVNSQIPINITMGNVLTGSAKLPENSTRCDDDPLHDAPPAWKKWIMPFITLIIAIIIGLGVYWVGWTKSGQETMQYLDNLVKSAEAPAANPANPTTPAEKPATPAAPAQ